MPVVSKAQNAAMHAAASGHSTLGIPKKVGQEFTADQTPGSVKSLPERVTPSRSKILFKRGAISSRAMKKHAKPASAGDTEDIKSKTSME